ncbi:unnamed protein product, partial [marine sediment metagenome]
SAQAQLAPERAAKNDDGEKQVEQLVNHAEP